MPGPMVGTHPECSVIDLESRRCLDVLHCWQEGRIPSSWCEVAVALTYLTYTLEKLIPDSKFYRPTAPGILYGYVRDHLEDSNKSPEAWGAQIAGVLTKFRGNSWPALTTDEEILLTEELMPFLEGLQPAVSVAA